jgi:CDP-paratose 2-epimerase
MNPILITGGAGFIGTNLAKRFLSHGRSVIVLDDLSRPGVEDNMRWLADTFGNSVRLEQADVRDPSALARTVPRAAAVFHLAAQTAVTTSLVDPVLDFEINARGTLNVLEALRRCKKAPPLVFTSTNKVYGDLGDIALDSAQGRYEPSDPQLRRAGVSEQRALDFHTPYGCSKGTADQYVLEYARTFGLPAAVFRMSCIYGPHQCGTEDQGWVAHFLIQSLKDERVCVYGDGMQVRDLLYVEDLVDAFMLALARPDSVMGHAFNIGGGAERAASLNEVLAHIRALHGRGEVDFGEWRTSDQRYYVSNTGKFRRATGWAPQVGVEQGIAALYAWLKNNRTSTGQRQRAPLPSRVAESRVAEPRALTSARGSVS